MRKATETLAQVGERLATLALEDESLLAQFHLRPDEERLVRLTGGTRTGEHGFARGCVFAAGIIEIHGIQRGVSGRSGVHGDDGGDIPRIADDEGIREEV